MLLLLLFHTYGTGGAFCGTHPTALAIAVINSNLIAVNDCFRTIYPTELAFGAYL